MPALAQESPSAVALERATRSSFAAKPSAAAPKRGARPDRNTGCLYAEPLVFSRGESNVTDSRMKMA